MPHLMIQYPDGRSLRYALEKQEVIVGRDATCDLPLQDAITSRQHARLHRDEAGRIWITDLRSKNGLLINDRPSEASALRSGDRIGIGTCQLVFFDDEATPPASASSGDSDGQPGDAPTIGQPSAWGKNQELELSQLRLRTLYELNERLTGRLDRDDLLRELLAICREQLRFEYAGIAVWRGQPHPLQWIATDDAPGGAGDGVPISRSIVDRALFDAERIVINDTADGAFNPTASIVSNNIRSAMCVPMENLGRVRGIIYGHRVSSTGGYTREDIDFFAAMGRLGAMGLMTVQLVEEIKQRERVEFQIGLARQIQTRLLPGEPFRQQGVSIDALSDPGQRVSGDYFDYFVRSDGKIVIVIADVAGKGIPASLLMANLQAAVRVTLRENGDLIASVAAMNRLLCQNAGDDRFVTAIFGLLDPAARTFTFINAGHHEPYLIQERNQVETLQSPHGADLPIGIDSEYAYRLRTLSLDARPSMLLFHTDGVGDAENETGEQFGETRFTQAVVNQASQPSDELIVRVRRSIKQFTRNTPQTDDITLLAVELS